MTTRRTHRSIRIDFTPLTAVALLLIVFFVFLESRTRPKWMQQNFRDKEKSFCAQPPCSDAHVFLLGNNQVGFLRHLLKGQEAELIAVNYSVKGLRRQLMDISLNHKYGAYIVISPTSQSTFKNLVDVLDELNIVGNVRFVLSGNLTTAEENLIRQYERYLGTNPELPAFIRIVAVAKLTH